MKHTLACVAIIFSSGCIAPDTEPDDSGAADVESTAARVGPRPSPTAPHPPGGSIDYLWTSSGTVYDFDSFSEFGTNLIDPEALMVRVPYVEAGDYVVVDVVGGAYAEHAEPGVSCALQVYVADGLRSEAPIEVGGGIGFPLDDDALQAHVSTTGRHIATADGLTTVRILGRVSRPDRFCGLAGTITIRVTHGR